MTFPRYSIRTALILLGILTFFSYEFFIPTWRYYRLPRATRDVLATLDRTVTIPSNPPSTLDGLLQILIAAARGPNGGPLPIYFDENGTWEAGATPGTGIVATPGSVTIGESLSKSLKPLGLGAYVKNGLVTITSESEAARAESQEPDEVRRIGAGR